MDYTFQLSNVDAMEGPIEDVGDTAVDTPETGEGTAERNVGKAGTFKY